MPRGKPGKLISLRIDPDLYELVAARCDDLGIDRTTFFADAAAARANADYRGILSNDPCAYCGGEAEAIEHVTPRAKGGDDGWRNLAATCTSCNSQKGMRPLLYALLGETPPAEGDVAAPGRCVSFRWEPEFVALIDEKRGDVPRSKFVRRAVEEALLPPVGSAKSKVDAATREHIDRLAEGDAAALMPLPPPAARPRCGPKRQVKPIPKAGKEKR